MPEILPLPDDCLPLSESELLRLLRYGPRVDADGRLCEGGVLDGMTVDEVLADRERYRRIVGD